ncbi:MAG: methyltransferase domain-containing protein [Polyangiales bacterium]
MTEIDQVEYWNGPAGEKWALLQENLDRTLSPLGDRALAAARVVQNERVLDVGCGCGTTTIALSRAVGDRGHVVGVDLSAPMLARARQRASALGLRNLRFDQGDAGSAKLPEQLDVVFSRFGVMFFTDPPAAFAHLARALRKGGRLAFVCWRPLSENPWLSSALEAAADLLPNSTPTVAGAPGPFGLSDRSFIVEVLERAGFDGITVEAFDHHVVVGRTLDEAAEMAMKTGPVSARSQELDEPTRAEIHKRIRQGFAPFAHPELTLGSATFIVTARRSA